MFKATGKATIIASVALVFGMAAEAILDGGLVISKAHAVIGRPLTPVSVAGVARRTTRRTIRRTAVYAAALPGGCSTVVIEGVTLHQCGGTYYQPYGTQYVVVKVE